MKRTLLVRRVLASAVALGAVTLALPATAVSAAPVDAKRAEAERLSRQIEALGDRESALAERYNAAVLKVQSVQQRTKAAEARLAEARQQMDQSKGRIRDVAINAYIRGGSSGATNVSVPGLNLGVASVYAKSVSSDASDTIDEHRAAAIQVGEEQARLADAQRDARAGLAEAAKRRNEVVKAEAQLRQTLAKVKGDLARLVAEAQAARLAAQAREAEALSRRRVAEQQQRASRSRATSPASVAAPTANPLTRPAAPAVRSGAQAAVAEAMRHVGKPYRWGGAGPDSFDCSGLTLVAWRAAGVSLPHYTGAQYSATTHISLSELQPGDLVYKPNMGHMGMYIGNGQMIEAPRTGENVRIRPLRADLTLASRP